MSEPKYFRMKPVVIEAMRLTVDSAPFIGEWMDGAVPEPEAWVREDGGLDIHTLEGVMTANLGDWIIRGVMGEFYPCKPDIFEATYEAVS